MTNKNRKKKMEEQTPGEVKLKGYLDMIAPSVIQFYTDHYICGNTYRSVWALREYPTATDEQAILRHLGEKDGVTLRIYTRQVTPAEEKKIISNAANKNRMKLIIIKLGSHLIFDIILMLESHFKHYM